MSGTPFSNVNNIHVHSMIPEDQKNMYRLKLHTVKFVGHLISCILWVGKSMNLRSKQNTYSLAYKTT